MLYDLCERHAIPYMNCGKWVVAQTEEQMGALRAVHDFARSIDVPIRFLDRKEAAEREPEVRAEAGVLESPTTGIVDSHGLMMCLLGLFEEAGGVAAVNSPVQSVTPLGSGTPGSGGWEISVKDGSTGEESTKIGRAHV